MVTWYDSKSSREGPGGGGRGTGYPGQRRMLRVTRLGSFSIWDYGMWSAKYEDTVSKG